MNANRWKRLETLFIAALELEPAERAAFLDKACADDSALREELEAMLSVDEESIALAVESRLLSQDAPGAEKPDTLAGTRIGPYRLEKLIGKGGMGEVYLAQRDDDQYKQKVALKLVRPGYRSSHLLSRFRMERQVLARLTHPNITQLLDGGIDNEGRPYLVMQYVEGISITKFCDKHALSIDERLELFRTVCSAVQHAHRNLVVHRDLKPSNILVTEDGVVKLLDFGIAKLLNPDWEMSIAVTQSQVRLMTPEYAAPEQVKGETITTATDVYALGVLLYELLSGRRPYRLSHRMQAEIERIVCEESPVRPSTAFTEVDGDDAHRAEAAPETISRARRTGVNRLKRILQGDLDNIVLMALRKEPARRYASAEQFSEDIKRYLVGLPVAAEKDRVSYRFKKFVQRNSSIVAVIAGAMLLILAFGVVMAVQAVRISNQADHLAVERDRARMEAEKATQVANFLEDLFKASNPFEATSERRDTLRVRDFLAFGVQNLETSLEDQPAVKSALLDVLGTVHLDLGDLETATPLLEQALDIRREIHKDGHVDVAASMAEMAALYKAKGDFKAAEPLLESSLTMLHALKGDNHLEVAAGMQRLGSLRQQQGNYVAADSLYRKALTMRRLLLGDNHFDVSSSMNKIAEILYLQGKYNQADSVYREIIAIRVALLGENHPDVAGSMNDLGLTLHRKGEFEEAEEILREALRIRKDVLGPIHPHIASGMQNLAALLKAKKDYEAAEPLYRESLAMNVQLAGEEHPTYALGLHNLAALLKAKGDYEEAIPLYQKALATRRKLLGNEHPSVAATLNNLGILLKAQRNYFAAEPHLREALAINRKLLDPNHPRIGLTLDALGDLLYKTGQYAESKEVLDEALVILTKQFGEDHTFVKRTRKSLNDLQKVWDKQLAGIE